MSERSLHILMLDPHLAGGGQVRYVANLAREFTARGHRVVVGCRPGSVLETRAGEAGCEALPRFSLRGGLRLGSWRHDLRLMRHYLREERPDIVHVNGSQDHWVAGVTGCLLRHPVCVVRTRHNTYVVKDHLPNRVLNRRWTDFQVVVCDVVRRGLARQRAFDPQRMCSIHNGVDAEAFQADPEARRRAREEFGYRESDLVLGLVGRLVKAKGHTFLFQALAQLADTLPELRVLVLGQGNLEQALRAEVDSLGIADRVHWAGFRDDMAYCTQAFDIGVQPSIDCDTSSFSLKEQMAAGKPVVASDYGGLVEIVRDGVEGLIVPAGTVDPLAQAIRALVTNPERRTAMGAAGRERVLREFTVGVFAERTLDAYARALSVHEQRRGRHA